MTIVTKEIKAESGNEILANYIVQELLNNGITTVCLCPGARNSALVQALQICDVEKFFWYEERSAAFFALGRAKRDRKAVAVITTSGTAAGELLPAVMEAYYTNVPLLLITADRPHRFAGSNAPQTCEQVNLYGIYTPYRRDYALHDHSDLDLWDQTRPAHLNIRFEDPFAKSFPEKEFNIDDIPTYYGTDELNIDHFLSRLHYPFVVVGALNAQDRDTVADFLIRLDAPVYLEAVSGLREDQRLHHLRIIRTDDLWKASKAFDYPIDGILRLGGVPTFRLWRDLEDMRWHIKAFSITHLPFSGLSWANFIHTEHYEVLSQYGLPKGLNFASAQAWLKADQEFCKKMEQLFVKEPQAESSLVHELSKLIPDNSRVFLGNSLPIREWDLAADNRDRGLSVFASRGLNGIDGQISTFLGLSEVGRENWAIIGDLTALYDLAGPWIMSQLKEMNLKIVIINNSGGQIFARLFKEKEFIHAHDLSFAPLAEMWSLPYQKWTEIPKQISLPKHCIIEIIPDLQASQNFLNQLSNI